MTLCMSACAAHRCREITTRNNRIFHFWLLDIIPLQVHLCMVAVICVCCDFLLFLARSRGVPGDLCLVITTPNNRIFHLQLLPLIPILLEDMKC